MVKWTEKGELHKVLQVGQDGVTAGVGQSNGLLLALLGEVAGNFPSCPMLKDDYGREDPNARHGPNRGDRDRGQPGLNAPPPRPPTEDEIEAVTAFVGFPRELTVPAIQMANYDLAAAQNLLLDDLPGIADFARRQNAAKAERDAEREKRETEAALKMSMGDPEEEDPLSLPAITADEFKMRTKEFVKELFTVLMEGSRSGGVPLMQDDSLLQFVKTILGGDLLKDSGLDLSSATFQDAQRDALAATADEFQKQDASAVGSLDTPA
jgi:hypothetical protein